MEKLIELLNEYHFFNTEYIGYHLDKEENRIYFKTEVVDKGITNEQRISDEWLISKKFGFIKWLVDNDKIDIDKIDKKIRIYDYVEEYEEYDYVFPDIYKQLLMLLSISSSPIDDLISYLK